MNKILAVGILACGVGALPAAAAAYSNITIPDTVANASGSGALGTGGEDNEVETGNVLGQEWDLEAFMFDANSKKLQIQGGYNMVSGQYGTGWNQYFYSGDVFIDVNGDAVWGNAIGTDYSADANAYFTVGNGNFKWDYAIVFERAAGSGAGGGVLTGNYSVYQLNGATDLEVFFDANNKSNPFRYSSGGALVQGAGGSVLQTQANPALSQGIGVNTTHYLLGDIDLNFLAGAGTGDYTFHYTQGCGNDLLMGKTTAWSVPDGGLTLALLGFSLSTLGFMVPKRTRKQD